MSNPIKNRYDFVVYFDVENGNSNQQTRMLAVCRASTRKPDTASSRTYA